jgi:hypothetical protein
MAATFLTSHSREYDGHLWYDIVGMHLVDKHSLAKGS